MGTKKSVFQRIFSSKAEEVTKEVLSDTEVSEKYRSQLVAMADRLDGVLFWNKGEWAAKLTFGILISRATEMEEVLIYSKSLGRTFYKDVLRGLKCPTRILLDDHAGYENVIRYLPSNILALLTVRVLSPDKVAGAGVHFITTDYTFRCGLPDEDNELSGFASFNDPQRTQRWRNHFEKLWANSIECTCTTL